MQVLTTKRIDEKHHIEAYRVHDESPNIEAQYRIEIIKSTNGQPIPDDEPIILFRGRDRLALQMLKYYYNQCKSDGATDYQLATMQTMIDKFAKFAQDNPQTMKQPGITLGK